MTRLCLNLCVCVLLSVFGSGCVYINLGGGGGTDAEVEPRSDGAVDADMRAEDAGTIGTDSGHDAGGALDAGTSMDAGEPADAGRVDAGALSDAGTGDDGARADASSQDSGTSSDGGAIDSGAIDSGAIDSGAIDGGSDGAADGGAEPDGGLSGQVDVTGDWGSADLYPELGGAYAGQRAMLGTCTFARSTGTMTVRPNDVAQTIVIGLRASDAAVLVNGATCGTPPATASTLRAINLAVNQGDGAEQVVVLDGLYGFFAAGSAGGGGTTLDLGDGFDRVRIRGTSNSDVITFGSLGVSFNGDAYRDIRHTNVEAFDVSLGASSDTFSAEGGLFGTGASGFVLGVSVLGGGGNDSLVGGPHNDTLRGGPGDDVLKGGLGDDALYGDAGDDSFREGLASSGSDSFSGGAGTDNVDYGLRFEDLTVTMDGLAADDGERDEADNVGADVEDLRAGAGDDHITGNALPNAIQGGPGDDTLAGGDGNDTLEGGDGDDALDGGDGDNNLLCGAGADMASHAGDGRIDCESSADTVYRRTGLVAWFKADAIENTTNNALIATWPNSADPRWSATQNDGAKKPIFLTGVRNGLPIVRFAEESLLVTGLTPAVGAAPRTAFVVARGGAMAWNQDRGIFAWGDFQDLALYMVSINAGWPQYAGTFYRDRHYTWSGRIDDFQVVSATYDGSTHRMWIDGASPLTASYPVALQTGAGPLQLGVSFIGDIAEVILYADALDDDAREAIECALQRKWATTALPQSCP